MVTIDLGYPILLLILILWAIFAVVAIVFLFFNKGSLKGFKNLIKYLTDTQPHRKKRSNRA